MKLKPGRRTKKMLLLTASTLFACFILEFSVRLILKQSIVLYPRFHTGADYGDYRIRRLKPNTVFWHRSIDGAWKFTVNAQGFRAARDFTYGKPAGTLRVICLGDSHTQGFECRQERTYPSVIEERLKDLGFPAEVLNAGVSGFSTAEAIVFLENEGIKYRPDVVVLGFFGNDLDDNAKAGLFRIRDGALVPAKYEHIPGVKVLDTINRVPLLPWLSQNSYAYSHLFNTVWNLKKMQLTAESAKSMQAEYAVKVADSDAAVVRAKHELAAALAKRLYEFCSERGIVLIILDLPQLAEDDAPFRPSVPDDLLPCFRENSDSFVYSSSLLKGSVNDEDIFVPHGQRHISESTHRLLGEAAAGMIALKFGSDPVSPRDAEVSD